MAQSFQRRYFYASFLTLLVASPLIGNAPMHNKGFMITDLLESVIQSRALFTAAELNLAELLENNPQTADELAHKTKTHPEALSRLLQFLCLKNIVTRDASNRYALPASSHPMLGHHPQTIKPFLLHDDPTRWNSFGHLTYSITTGKPSFDMLYGKDYFSSLKENPELSKRFDQAMNIISQHEDALIANTLPLQGIVADVGGGNGQLAQVLIAQQAGITNAIVFDLPNVVAHMKPSAGITPMGGSFFEPMNITADVFILKRILHDWDNKQAHAILNNVSKTMSLTSDLWIIDGILDRAQNAPLLAAIDLGLLTIFGGQERTYAMFDDLINQSGLVITEIVPLTPILFAIRCRKKTTEF